MYNKYYEGRSGEIRSREVHIIIYVIYLLNILYLKTTTDKLPLGTLQSRKRFHCTDNFQPGGVD